MRLTATVSLLLAGCLSPNEVTALRDSERAGDREMARDEAKRIAEPIAHGAFLKASEYADDADDAIQEIIEEGWQTARNERTRIAGASDRGDARLGRADADEVTARMRADEAQRLDIAKLTGAAAERYATGMGILTALRTRLGRAESSADARGRRVADLERDAKAAEQDHARDVAALGAQITSEIARGYTKQADANETDIAARWSRLQTDGLKAMGGLAALLLLGGTVAAFLKRKK